MAYATVAELAEHMGNTDLLVNGVIVSSARTSRYTAALAAATTAIDSKCGRTFTSRSATTKVLVPHGGELLEVPDLVTVTTLKVDDDASGTFETTLTTSDYELGTWAEHDEAWPYEYVIRLDEPWPAPIRNGRRRLVQIVGTWGWSSVPSPVQQACLLMAARLLQRGNAALGVQGVSEFGPFSIRNSDPDVEALLAPYVKLGHA